MLLFTRRCLVAILPKREPRKHKRKPSTIRPRRLGLQGYEVFVYTTLPNLPLTHQHLLRTNEDIAGRRISYDPPSRTTKREWRWFLNFTLQPGFVVSYDCTRVEKLWMPLALSGARRSSSKTSCWEFAIIIISHFPASTFPSLSLQWGTWETSLVKDISSLRSDGLVVYLRRAS